ncbi:hypothetical protein [Mycolicibacterium hodleri]|uniref:hypothetical protein n=1 Tax=Mycolicibacterium hodleri TaxID=49897 RepID=UPI00115B8A9D|nr:hypothetical protein [Mycolicibacterium hodleri]
MSSLETRLLMSKLVVAAVVGLILGALVGGLAFGALATDTTATAFLRLKAPIDLTAIAGGASQITPDNQDNTAKFVTGEVAYLSGEGFAEAVGRKMAQNEPAVLNIAQASESAMITISCSSKSADVATRTVQTAIDLYSQDLAQRVDERLRFLLPKLAQWEQRDAVDGTRLQEVRRVRESVELQAAEASTFSVVQPPTPNRPSSQQWLIGVILGAMVGGSCAIAAMLVKRRRSDRGSVVKALGGTVDAVLLPALDLDVIQRTTRTDERERLGRALYAQCRSTGTRRSILVVGASETSGSSVVTSLLETAASGYSSPTDEFTSVGQHSASPSAESPTARVVDGGTIGDARLTPDVLAAATDIVLVAQLEADTIADVSALRTAAASGAAPVVAAFTYRRSRVGRSGRRRPAAAPTSSNASDSDERTK